jgi:hypothetical protein
MGEPISLPHAGIKLAVPEGYVRQPLRQRFEALRSAWVVDETVRQAATLLAYPVKFDITAEQFADGMVADMEDEMAFRNVEVIKATPMRIAGIDGYAKLISYSHRGRDSIAAAAFIVRSMPDSDVAICYQLLVEALAEYRQDVLPTLGEIIKTMSLRPVESPIRLGIGSLGRPVRLERPGCSLRQPVGWFAVAMPSVQLLELGQVDFTRNGVMSPVARLKVADAPPGSQSMTCAKRSLAEAQQLAKDVGDRSELVHEGLASLGTHESYEFVLLCMPDESRPADETEAGTVEKTDQPTAGGAPISPLPQQVCIAQRSLCISMGGSGRYLRTYSLTLICESGNVQAVRAMMDKLAEGFALTSDSPGDESPE